MVAEERGVASSPLPPLFGGGGGGQRKEGSLHSGQQFSSLPPPPFGSFWHLQKKRCRLSWRDFEHDTWSVVLGWQPMMAGT